MSDTPISDSTPHNVAELGMLCRRLERELNASNIEIERLTSKVAQLYEGAEEQNQRIKRLEEALESIREYWNRDNNNRALIDACWYAIDTASEALEAKEAKP
jgi:predicted  nucleic acid-binding Zn-ribbon protein